jgi:hypothetical protein
VHRLSWCQGFYVGVHTAACLGARRCRRACPRLRSRSRQQEFLTGLDIDISKVQPAMTAEAVVTTDNLSRRRPIAPLCRAFVIRSDTLPSLYVQYCSARRILAGVASFGSHVGRRKQADMAFAPSGCSEWVEAARRPMRRIPRAPRHPRDAGKEKRYDPRLPDFKIPCGVLKGGSHLCAPKLLPPGCCAACATGRHVHKPPRISLCHQSRE